MLVLQGDMMWQRHRFGQVGQQLPHWKPDDGIVSVSLTKSTSLALCLGKPRYYGLCLDVPSRPHAVMGDRLLVVTESRVCDSFIAQ